MSIGRAFVVFVFVAACRSTATEVPAESKNDAKPEPARTNTCTPSSVHGAACPARTVPPGTGSSPEGCKSDADCKAGIEGRCVGQHVTSAISPRDNLLGAPPPPPTRSRCVYDACREDKDCGANARCECAAAGASEWQRNQCRALDNCLSDRECPADNLCTCGASPGLPNACTPGNCRTNADCKGAACEPDSNGFRYCRSPQDACGKAEDCKHDPNRGMPICVYRTQAHARVCDVLAPVPPG